jgi:GT2 family glycosyltransferase
VIVSWVRGPYVNGEFAECLLGLVDYDDRNNRRVIGGRGGFFSKISSANISHARNEICRQFLEIGTAPWLLMLDTDMTFEPDLIERLLEFADEDKAPIVGGLCFAMDEERNLFPTLYDLTGVPGALEFVRYHEFAPDAMMQVAATGAACLLIHRSALEKVRDYVDEGAPAGRAGFSQAMPWFQETVYYDRRIGEDVTFCLRAGKAGVPVYVNTAVKLGHIKHFALTYDRYVAQRAIEYARREQAGEES